MNKLTQIRQALRENPSIKIVKSTEFVELPRSSVNYLPSRMEHIVDFYVAPISGIYDIKSLQALMMSLVPKMEPTDHYDFCNYGDDGGMKLGSLWFREIIGNDLSRHEVVLTDEDMFSSVEFVNGRQTIEHNKYIFREINIWLFPDAQIISEASKYKGSFFISGRKLAEYCAIV